MQIIRHKIEITEEEKRLQKEIKALPLSVFEKLSDGRVDELSLIVAGTHSHYMAMKKFEEFDAILMTAKYCLGAGSRFDHKAYSESNGVRTYDKNAQYHLNLHDLKSAVVWYNSSIDYLLQIIYFGFEFYTPFHTNSKYREELRKCIWNEKFTFYKDFCTLANANDNVKNLKIKWENLQQHDSVKCIRKFANAIKHHGGFELTEIADQPTRISVTEPFSGKTADWDEIMERPTIRFIELVRNLIVVHNEVVTFEEYLFDELGLSNIPSTIRVGIDKIKQRFSARDLLNAR